MAKKKAAQRASHPNGPLLELPSGQSQEIAPANLLLDPQNLRLFDVENEQLQNTPVQMIGQRSIQSVVYDLILNDSRFDVESLIQSIANNGFLKHERLIVASYDGRTYLVLEGNRRLTAVRRLKELSRDRTINLSPQVLQSLETLPCFVLEGNAIDGSEERLAAYRHASEVYIGMRHLMEVKSWDPASRYEFQARLIFDQNWTPEQVAERFGRKKSQVLTELKAQVLYHDFRAFEKKLRTPHRLTYNAFAEAARSGAVMRWLEWSDAIRRVQNKETKDSFFHYLVRHIRSISADADSDSDASQSAEQAVRHLSQMLSLQDPDINGALADHEFETAELLYEDRKEGKLAKRLAQYIRYLKRVPLQELKDDARRNRDLLTELSELAAEYASALKRGKEK